jgi:hypothetical protein
MNNLTDLTDPSDKNQILAILQANATNYLVEGYKLCMDRGTKCHDSDGDQCVINIELRETGSPLDGDSGCDSNSNYTPKANRSKKLKSRSKAFMCKFEDCGKCFEYKWILERHINSHFCFKLFKCDYDGCDKAYKSKENLNLHVKNKHLGIKPYQCSYCKLQFSHRNGKKLFNALGKTYHERKVHLNYLPHHCEADGCGSSFASKSALKYHVKNQH